MSDLSERIAGVLFAAGLSDHPETYDSSIHSWRCEHPDRYGKCTCFADLVADLSNVLDEKGEGRG